MQEIEISKIIRSKRRTIALVVTHDATLVIRSPLKTPLDYLKNLVNRKRDWIQTKMREMQSKPRLKAKEFVNGESFLCLGESYKLKIVDDIVGDVELRDNLLLSREKASCARDVVIKWYRSEAQKKIKERCEWYSSLTGYKPLSIKISNAQKRWGSSGHRGTVNFNWRLIMAPVEIIDYIVVHELVHLEQRDHSVLFWDKVRSIMPDFKIRQKWLKDNGGTLSI